MHHVAVHAVVGDVQQARDELAIPFDQVSVERGPRRELPLEHEAALRPDGDDDGVFDHLRLHQPQDLGAEIVVAIAPADAPACDLAAAQVDALELPRVHVDLEERAR